MDAHLAHRIVTRALIAIVFGTTAFTASAGQAWAQGGRLAGSWAVTITLRNCATNAALGPPVRALYTYYRDGTVLESPGALLFAPGQRSVGHGNWTQAGRATFTERVAAMLLFGTPPDSSAGSPGFQPGWQLMTAAITMTDENHFTATSDTQFFDLNVNPYRSGCSTRVGVRFR